MCVWLTAAGTALACCPLIRGGRRFSSIVPEVGHLEARDKLTPKDELTKQIA